MKLIKNAYSRVVDLGTNLQMIVLLLLRLFWGVTFFFSGWGKLMNIQGVAAYFASLHIPFETFSAYTVGYVECIGGACLVLGFLARLAAIPLTITMVVALLTAHFDVTKNVFSDPHLFITQTAFSYLLVSLIILAFGPGKLSIDRWIEKK